MMQSVYVCFLIRSVGQKDLDSLTRIRDHLKKGEDGELGITLPMLKEILTSKHVST